MGTQRLKALLRRSEYGSVAYLVERPTWETQAEQYSDTVLANRATTHVVNHRFLLNEVPYGKPTRHQRHFIRFEDKP